MKRNKQKIFDNNFNCILIVVAAVIIIGICYHIVKENKKQLHNTENRNEVIDVINKLSNITVNDIISFGNESYIVNKVEADTNNLSKKFIYSFFLF